MALTREQILSVEDLARETVHVPEWGGDVIVRTMTGTERGQWESAWSDWRKRENKGDDSSENWETVLCCFTVCADDGSLLFLKDGKLDRDMVLMLAGKSGKAILRVSRAAYRLNAIGAESVGELEKNSDGPQSEDSGSD